MCARSTRPLLLQLSRLLHRQEYLTSHLSTNLSFLFARKQVIIELTPPAKLPDDAKELFIVSLTRLRRVVGGIIFRKVVLSQNCRGVMKELKREGHEMMEWKLEKTVRDWREAMWAQKELDKLVARKVREEVEVVNSDVGESQKLDLRRFEGFAKGRLKALEDVYDDLDATIRNLEGIVK